MTLPAYDKTWDFGPGNNAVNIDLNTSGVALTDYRTLVLRIVTELLARTAAWTCWGSCDGSGGGSSFSNAGVNKWDGITKLVWANAGSNHSWIVLTQSGISTKAAICIDLNVSGAPYQWSLIFSPSAGFGTTNGGADGTATARPTASDEIVLVSAATIYQGSANTTFDCALNVVSSTDGQCNRIWIWKASTLVAMYVFDKAKNPITGWTTPGVGAAFTTAGPLLYAQVFGAAAIKGMVTGVSCTFFSLTLATTSGVSLGASQTSTHPITGDFPLTGLTLYTTTATRGPGAYGSLFDFYFGSTTPADGECYPSVGTRTWIQLNDVVHPWPDVAPLLT